MSSPQPQPSYPNPVIVPINNVITTSAGAGAGAATTKGQPSGWRIVLAFCTGGLSLLVCGWRKPIGRSKVIHTG